MPRFDFGSPAAAMTGALQQALIQQEAKRRQDMLDALTRQKEDRAAQMGMEELSISQQQLRLQQEQARKQQERLAAQDAITDAERRASAYGPDEQVRPEDADVIRKFTPGVLAEGQPTQGAFLGEDESGIPQYDVKSGGTVYRGNYDQRVAASEAAQKAARDRYVNVPNVGLVDISSGNPNVAVKPNEEGEIKEVGGYIYKRDPGSGEWKQAGLARDPYADRLGAGSKGAGGDAYGASQVDRMLGDIDSLMADVGLWTAGPAAALPLPGTPARDFRARLNTLKANVGFNQLTEMRAASRTGGALGQVSNIELELLTSALGALDQAQSPDALRDGLRAVRTALGRWDVIKKGIPDGHGGTRIPSRQEVDAILGGEAPGALQPGAPQPGAQGRTAPQGRVYYDMNGNPIQR